MGAAAVGLVAGWRGGVRRAGRMAASPREKIEAPSPESVAAPPDWAGVIDRLIEGDRLALLELSRLVNGFLAQLGAYDFRDEWDDLIQEVVLAAAQAVREGRIREREAFAGYLRTTARFVFIRRLKQHQRCERSAWEEPSEAFGTCASRDGFSEQRRDVEQALQRLPEKWRQAVVAVHVEGHTYDEAAARTGIPLGSLKRYLRDGLARLRMELAQLVEES
jgi:RNA polymerase sigma factor (sigma-70 family)